MASFKKSHTQFQNLHMRLLVLQITVKRQNGRDIWTTRAPRVEAVEPLSLLHFVEGIDDLLCS